MHVLNRHVAGGRGGGGAGVFGPHHPLPRHARLQRVDQQQPHQLRALLRAGLDR